MPKQNSDEWLCILVFYGHRESTYVLRVMQEIAIVSCMYVDFTVTYPRTSTRERERERQRAYTDPRVISLQASSLALRVMQEIAIVSCMYVVFTVTYPRTSTRERERGSVRIQIHAW